MTQVTTHSGIEMCYVVVVIIIIIIIIITSIISRYCLQCSDRSNGIQLVGNHTPAFNKTVVFKWKGFSRGKSFVISGDV